MVTAASLPPGRFRHPGLKPLRESIITAVDKPYCGQAVEKRKRNPFRSGASADAPENGLTGDLPGRFRTEGL